MDPRLLVDWLALHLLPGLGPAAAKEALERFRDPGEIAYRVPPAELADCGRVDLERLVPGRRDLRQRVEREIRLAEKHRVRLLPLCDPAYPAALAEIASAPMLLYIRGSIEPGVVSHQSTDSWTNEPRTAHAAPATGSTPKYGTVARRTHIPYQFG